MAKSKIWLKFTFLFLAIILASWLYLTFDTQGDLSFALLLRGKKWLSFIVVGIATALSTIAFQTITRNQLLTPNILGFDQLYVLFQTVLLFFAHDAFKHLNNPYWQFFINIILMLLASYLLFLLLFKKTKQNMYLLLMVGMVLGIFLRSISTFLQVMMDPNEFDKLQTHLFANFHHIETDLLWIAAILVAVAGILLFWQHRALDILLLGHDQANILGVPVMRVQFFTLCLVSLLTAVTTALVGPITFLGFIVAHLAYQFFHTYRHSVLFIGGSLWGILLLIAGEFLVEELFHFATPLSVVIEFVGGLYFIWLLLYNRRRNGS